MNRQFKFVKCLPDHCIRGKFNITQVFDVLQYENTRIYSNFDDGLGYTIKVYDWYNPEDHKIYCTYHRSMKNVTVSDFVNMLVSYFKCRGISYIYNGANIYCHIPLNHDISEGSSDDDDEIKALVP